MFKKLLILFALCGLGADYEVPSVPIPNPIPGPLTGATSPLIILQPESPQGAWLRSQIVNAQPGSVINVPPGFYVLGKTYVQCPPNITVRGAGKERTWITSANANFGGINPGISLNNGVAWEDTTVQLNIGKTFEGELIGMGQNAPANCTAYLRRNNFIGTGWCVYIWGQYGNKIILEDCHCWAAHRVIACQTSSGPDAAAVDMHRTWLHLDASLTTAGGEVGPNCIGIVSSAGLVRMFQGGIDGVGGSQNDFIAGAWCDIQGETFARIEMHGVTSRLKSNGAKAMYDAYQQKGLISIFDGSGSGPGGNWLKVVTN